MRNPTHYNGFSRRITYAAKTQKPLKPQFFTSGLEPAYEIDDILSECGLLPAQYGAPSYKDEIDEGLVRLCAALLTETLRDCTDPPRACVTKGTRQWCISTARAWFRYPDDGAISCRLCCALLGLDLEAVQRRARDVVKEFNKGAVGQKNGVTATGESPVQAPPPPQE